jgi:ABC-type multidrug transport system ATPase subunit
VSALSLRGLTVQRGRRLVLEDVSLTAPAGAVTAVLGPAGAGKTSLLAAIAGLMPLARGAVFRGGMDATRLSARRRGVVLLTPGSMLPEKRSLQTALRRLAGRKGAARADELIRQFGLAGAARQDVGLLSHGEGMLALAAARLLRPADILLMDEAGTGLDHESSRILSAFLRREADAGRTVMVATRALGVALAADHLVLLSEGRVLQTGTPASIYAEPHDPLAAHLTGAANILQGHVRELRPGGFIWAGLGRFLQAADPDLPRPSLGSPVTLCLRPERLSLLDNGASAENTAEGVITDLRSAGPLLDLRMETALGPLLVTVPSWGLARYPAAGQHRRVGWSASAAVILP